MVLVGIGAAWTETSWLKGAFGFFGGTLFFMAADDYRVLLRFLATARRTEGAVVHVEGRAVCGLYGDAVIVLIPVVRSRRQGL